MIFKSLGTCFIFLFFFNSMYGMNVEDKNAQFFEKIKKDLISWRYYPGNKQPSTWSQRRIHGYNGLLTPIVEYPRIYRSGFIIENAQPSCLFGLSYDESRSPEDIILIAQEDTDRFEARYTARIKPRNNRATVLACCLFDNVYKYRERPNFHYVCLNNGTMDCQLAILWKEIHQSTASLPVFIKTYITMAKLFDIQQADDELDLDLNKMEIR